MRELNEFWHTLASRMIRDALSNGVEPELISESMLTVAIGHELSLKGFRELANDLGAIAGNFARQAEKVEKIAAAAGVSPTPSTTQPRRH
ncbi:hypothetical protein GJ689_07730 [Rhodoplanes serenus]|uniref:Uncharacterized protein n=1 Tax=Rhodoplanes serenus TaxID=200615 RepID=A0A9X5ARE1_9BRAD|nr:hypothetical protein [Rhodoplanes serenus]MTW16096.1 hypothetical protein [Rhodoplanes serenus]